LVARPGVHWDRLLFSAKGSVFKAWFPLARDWLGFEHAVVSFHPTDCTFQVRLPVPRPVFFGDAPELLTGRFLGRDGLLLTAIVVPQPDLGAASSRTPRLRIPLASTRTDQNGVSPIGRVASGRDAVPDEVVATRLSSCRSRPCVSASSSSRSIARRHGFRQWRNQPPTHSAKTLAGVL
jgi:hypothetical protein